MPPKVKVTKEEIVKAGIEIIRKDGEVSINARSIASYLNCSTQPIFSNFATMEELQNEIMTYAHNMYLSYLEEETKKNQYTKYKSFGMAYIRFAKEEKNLFKMLFMCDRKGKELPSTADFDESVKTIMETSGLSKEKATLMHLEMWTFVHGIASMIATSFLEFDTELISKMTSDVYNGIRKHHLGE
ncbi:MAG: TetR/AcrR family transcriptional regulator [Clostridia bacterium]|nr:TetR/AcrR family transcriptional regulator [Clostridia bacterium]